MIWLKSLRVTIAIDFLEKTGVDTIGRLKAILRRGEEIFENWTQDMSDFAVGDGSIHPDLVEMVAKTMSGLYEDVLSGEHEPILGDELSDFLGD